MRLVQLERFPDYYISDLGQFDTKHAILSTNKRSNSKKILHWLKPSYDDKGHCNFYVKDGTKMRHIGLHHLLAEAFIPNPEGKTDVHHKDFNPSNNSLDNLMWVTKSQHRSIHNTEEFRDKLRKICPFYEMPRAEGSGKAPRSVAQLNKDDDTLVEKFNSIAEAGIKTKINPKNIIACCKGRLKTAGGYKWVYLD